MKLELEFNDQAKSGLRKNFLEQIIKKTLAESGLDFLRKKNISLSAANVLEEEIQNLNRIYRRKNSATDILSFAEYKNQKELAKASEKDIFLGELVLCYNDIRKYAAKNGIDAQQEAAKVVSHGTLHLLGFCHGKKMFAVQNGVAGNKK